jgi:hypothetical protein
VKPLLALDQPVTYHLPALAHSAVPFVLASQVLLDRVWLQPEDSPQPKEVNSCGAALSAASRQHPDFKFAGLLGVHRIGTRTPKALSLPDTLSYLSHPTGV